MPTWDNLNEAFQYLRTYISQKKQDRFSLSEIDLALVSNFKGGNASVVEPLNDLRKKLTAYTSALVKLDHVFGGLPLRDIPIQQLAAVQELARAFLQLAKTPETAIKGFGPANASALLAAHFPDTLPVIDRLVLSGADIEHTRNNQGQVVNIEGHYPILIAKCHEALIASPQMSLRELDKHWFERGQLQNKVQHV